MDQTSTALSDLELDFASAFDDLAKIGDAPAPEASNEPAPAEPEAAAEAPAEEPAPAESVEEAPPVEAESAEPAPEPEPAPQPAPDDDILKRFAALMDQAQSTRQPEPPPPPPAEQPPMFSAEEEKLLESYEKDWPDVARAEALRRRAEYKELVGYVFAEVAKELSPLFQTVQTLSEKTHLTDLYSRVEDYDDVRDRVIDWANKQPPYLRAAYNHVIQQGTVDEVADLITRYRQETTNMLDVKTAKKTETELPAATKQAVAALAPVSSKRSAVPRATDPEDFDSAFSAFAEKLT